MPQLDSQFRYLSGIYFLVSILIWWMVPNIERHTTLIRIAAEERQARYDRGEAAYKKSNNDPKKLTDQQFKDMCFYLDPTSQNAPSRKRYR